VTIVAGWNRCSVALDRAPRLAVFAVDEAGESLRDVSVWLDAHPGRWSALEWSPKSVQRAAGEQAWGFEVRPPFDSTLRSRVTEDRAGWEVSRGTLRLEAGERRELVLRVAAEDLPVLLAEGIVLDEEGAPLSDQVVLLRLAGGGELEGLSGKDGSFRLDGPVDELRGDELAVLPFSDSLFPPVRDLALPATGIVLHRSHAPQTRVVDFIPRDALDGHVVEDAHLDVFVVDDEGRWRGLYCTEEEEGMYEVPFEPDLGLRWVATDFEHERTKSGVLELGASVERQRLEVRFDPGFVARYRIADARTGRPILGAVVRDLEGTELARSDSTGVLEVRTDEYPGDLDVEAKGYRDGCIVRLYMDRWMGTISLEPVEKGRPTAGH